MSCCQCKIGGKEFLDMGWCPRDPSQACGLPPKTVRSSLAVIVVVFTLLSALATIVFLLINKNWDVAVGVLGGVLSIGTGVLGYYFGFRSGNIAVQTPEEDV